MNRDEKIAFIEKFMIGDLQKQVHEALVGSDDRQLDDILKVIMESDEAARAALRDQLLHLAEDEQNRLKMPKKPKDDGGEKVW